MIVDELENSADKESEDDDNSSDEKMALIIFLFLTTVMNLYMVLPLDSVKYVTSKKRLVVWTKNLDFFLFFEMVSLRDARLRKRRSDHVVTF